MKVCVIGCVHGEIDDLYQAVEETEAKMPGGGKIDVVLCCGDFQAVRNRQDLQTMACPDKYKSMNTFYKYYSGEKRAPVLTLFVGGNHEASNHLQELPYGGWVAPNIYYLGIAGCVRLRSSAGAEFVVAGLSGIYDKRDVNKGRFECVPYDRSSERSIYHVRQFDANRLFLLPRRLDFFLSHDWPVNVVPRGDAKTEQLLRKKPFFREDVDKGELGSPVLRDLMLALRPKYWFSAHLHVKFAKEVVEEQNAEDLNLDDEDEVEQQPLVTKFLALDKIVKGRDFLQVIDVGPGGGGEGSGVELMYDADWLAIIKATHDKQPTAMRIGGGGAALSEQELASAKEFVRHKITGDLLRVSLNFAVTAPVHGEEEEEQSAAPLAVRGNPQLDAFYALLELKHIPPFTVPYSPSS